MFDTENGTDILALKYLLFWQTRNYHKYYKHFTQKTVTCNKTH